MFANPAKSRELFHRGALFTAISTTILCILASILNMLLQIIQNSMTNLRLNLVESFGHKKNLKFSLLFILKYKFYF